jgi:hypothetical protein
VRIASDQLAVCLLALLAVGCKPQSSSLPKPTFTLSQNEFDDQTLELEFDNHSSEMLCVSAVDIGSDWGSAVLKQAGREIYPTTQSNRTTRIVNDLNVLEPIYIVMPGKNKFYYDIADYDVAKGDFEASLNAKVFACKDYFDGGFVRWLPIAASMKGTITEFRSDPTGTTG